ncbi:MerR family transcriptional regulator [Enterococcus wangshanyuanii]|uniref:DNA-binding protein n=1 Tax=Enterococcus wangshanyuanii TaxID=2005703 RepID=A0ABQ1NH73_9ENTE|nr:MerR family transcriptional regulator [Enterococcus wangshanyuanii]GGC74542.1 hypothetical protein GCM10011573_00040 [Enterococcus wangshanyuanii]
MNENSMFSSWFETVILKTLEKYFEKFLDLANQRSVKPIFIQKKNVGLYYDGVSKDTLKAYEEKGLKRCEPIQGGNVYYHVDELERFMLKYQVKSPKKGGKRNGTSKAA